MRNLLDLIHEYQLLRSTEQTLAIDLDDAERARLMGLHRLLQGETPDPRKQRILPRVKLAMPVQFTLPGGFETGEIRDASGSGFGIATARPPAVGTRLIVRVAEPRHGREYVFPARVVWVSKFGAGRMGVALDGVPHRATFLADDTGVWQRSVRFGAARAEPMVA